MGRAAPVDAIEPPLPGRKRRWFARVLLSLLGLFLIGVALAWLNRETLTRKLVADELAVLDIDAQYEVETIATDRQILTDIVVGDPHRPDLTIERLELRVAAGLSGARVNRVIVTEPRLYGTWREGKLSFGALDPLLFPPEDEDSPFEFPDLFLKVVDGRGLLATEFGRIGLKVEGEGPLRGGFSGIVAANAPRLDFDTCSASGATAFGEVTIDAERPRFSGPIRLAALKCGSSLSLEDAELAISARSDRTFDGVEAGGDLGVARASIDELTLLGSIGDFGATWRDGEMQSRYTVAADALQHPTIRLENFAVEGEVAAIDGLRSVESTLDFQSGPVLPGAQIQSGLESVARQSAGTLLEPLAVRLREALNREAQSSSMVGEGRLAVTGEALQLTVPTLRIRGSSGATVLDVSRFRLASGPTGGMRYAGNMRSGGAGLPEISARVESRGGGGANIRMAMADYEAGSSRIAVPELALVQLPNGAVGFSGQMRASGPLPSGYARRLLVPLDGTYRPGGELAVWRRCTSVAFDALAYGNLSVEGQRITLCPARGRPILSLGSRGLRLAAGVPALDASGELGGTPISVQGGPVALAYPGVLTARNMDVALGGAEAGAQFRLTNLTAQLGSAIGGKFEGAEFRLANVPLDVNEANGDWTFVNDILDIGGGTFMLDDRQTPGRFEPLAGEGARVRLADNVINAEAHLREPATRGEILLLDLQHDLGTGIGWADIAVPGIDFGDALQPDDLTRLALGVVANVRGRVAGAGRIDWNSRDLTSTGRFYTDDLDFAAAFGPVQGASGSIRFTDLLGLTTADNQRLDLATMNPGIEVYDGFVTYKLDRGEVIAVKGGEWDFLGGTITLLPVDYRIGIEETRAYTLVLNGIDAARFVQRLELANLSARGTFDGRLPLLFDAEGGRIEDGYLRSRAPGGNLSYVGELTYEDLSPIANFAFDALRSLDYREMEVELSGPLTGEIVTQVRFDGISQGEGAQRNFVTRRIAKLPLQFNVNVRAEFYTLIGSLRSLYDANYVRSPIELGLVDEDGNPISFETGGPLPEPAVPDDLTPDEATIQRRESEDLP